ncbi:MAG: hypothetical protein CL424_19950 [Acidimicrobiaceae bacterium]|nr:hypothetical protein [Acidimicrobiaceae bacterium]
MNNVTTPSASAQPSNTEGLQPSLFGSQAFENADGQHELGFDDGKRPRAEPEGCGDVVDALLAELQSELSGEGDLPACKRQAESFAVPTWHERSERSDRPEFEQPPEFEAMTSMPDKKLALNWGWTLKRRYRGLSKRDKAVQREVYARCLGFSDLHGRDLAPAASAPLREQVRKLGCRSGVAMYIVGLVETAVTQGRMGLRLSAPEFRSLTGHALSVWWYAVGRLESLGIIQRVGTVKGGTKRYGGAPVQKDTNLYVPGPWWFEAGEGETWSPLEAALGLFAKVRRLSSPKAIRMAAKKAHEGLMGNRRKRRRETNTASRDRNRKRHHDLAPKVTSTPEVEAAADALAKHRQAEAQAQEVEDARQRARALMRGESVPLGDAAEPQGNNRDPQAAPDASKAEAVAQAVVSLRNAGVKAKRSLGSIMRQAVERLGGGSSPPAEDGADVDINCRPNFGRQSRRGRREEELFSSVEPQPPPKTPTQAPDKPPTPFKTPVSRPGAGDKSTPEHPACARARALDGKGPDSAGTRLTGSALRGPEFFRQAFAGLFGHTMEPEPG